MKKPLISIIIATIATLNLNAQESQKIIEQFFKNYHEKSCKIAIQEALATNPWLLEDTVLQNKLTNNLVQSGSDIGNYCGYEIIETIETGKSFVRYDCLVKHEKAPFKISIVLYQPQNKWQVNNIIVVQNRQINNNNNNRRFGNRNKTK